MSLFHILVTIILIFLTAGSFFLGASQRDTKKSLKELSQQDTQSAVTSNPDPSTPSSKTKKPAFSLLEEPSQALQASISSLLDRIEDLENTIPDSAVLTPVYQGGVSTPAFQPQTIYLGATSSNHREWTATGVEIMINSSNYPSNVYVIFDAGLSIVGGEAWARLKNKTTGAIISASQVSHNNSTVTWKSSSSFSLHSGNNAYVVELKSTSGEMANLAGARLKIAK